MTIQPSRLKNNGEPEERRHKRVKRVDQQQPQLIIREMSK